MKPLPVAQDGSLVLNNHVTVTVSRTGTHPSWKLHTLLFLCHWSTATSPYKGGRKCAIYLRAIVLSLYSGVLLEKERKKWILGGSEASLL